MKIVHLCFGNFYVDNFSYQENLLPKYHYFMGHSVSILTSVMTLDTKGTVRYYPKRHEYINNDGIKIVRIEYKSFLKPINKVLRRYVGLYETIQSEKPDIIFIHNCQFWDIKKVVKFLKGNLTTKVFVDNHADYINSSTNWMSKNILHRIIWRHCAKTIEPYTQRFFGVTPLRCEFLNKVYDISLEKIALLELGADDHKIRRDQKFFIRKKIRKQHNIDEEDFLLLSGGKIDERKNIHLLMEAVKDLKHIKLIIFGDFNDKMASLIKRLSNYDNIKNIGWISPDDVYDYFLASDLAVFPGTHSVYWEQAVGSGIPCIFKYWSGFNHINNGGNCKFLYHDSVNEIRETILEIASNEQVYVGMLNVSEGPGRLRFLYSTIAAKSIKWQVNTNQ